MRRILLLGASGFAGRHFATHARVQGMELVAAGRRQGSHIDVVCDLLDLESVERVIHEIQPDAIANLAGAASVSASLRDPGPTFAVNAHGVLNVLEAATRAGAHAYVLCVSSGDVYGRPSHAELPFAETSPVRPLTPYGASKAAMELLCEQYARASGLEVGYVRSFNHTGPGQSAAFAASTFARQLAQAESRGYEEVVLRTGDLTLARDFSDVRDIVGAYMLLIENRWPGAINACSGKPTKIGFIVDLLRTHSDVRIRTELDPDRLRPGDPPTIYGSPERLRAMLGWRPQFSMEDTTQDLLGWWREAME